MYSYAIPGTCFYDWAAARHNVDTMAAGIAPRYTTGPRLDTYR